MKRLSLLLTAFLFACGSGTEGKLVTIDMAVEVVGQNERAPHVFETGTGFLVELTEARLTLSSVVVYAPVSDDRMALSRLWLSRAAAHGGYDPFNGRRVRAEYLGPFTVDLLRSAPQALGSIEAESGAIDSASLVFVDDPMVASDQAFVRGTASKDGVTIMFEGALMLRDEALLRRVDGVRADGELAEGTSLTVQVRPFAMFDEAQFDRLGSVDGVQPITPETQVHTAWLFGTRSSTTYTILRRN